MFPGSRISLVLLAPLALPATSALHGAGGDWPGGGPQPPQERHGVPVGGGHVGVWRGALAHAHGVSPHVTHPRPRRGARPGKRTPGFRAPSRTVARFVLLSRMISLAAPCRLFFSRPSRVVPFDADTQKDLYALIKRGQVDMSGWEWDEVSEDAKQLIRRLLSTDMKKRPTATEALHHPWMTRGTPEEGGPRSLPQQPSIASAMVASGASNGAEGPAAPAPAGASSASRLEAALLRLHREGRLEGVTTRSDEASVALIQQLLGLGVLISDIPPREALEELVQQARAQGSGGKGRGRTDGMKRADTAMAPPLEEGSSDKSADMPRADTAMSAVEEARRKSMEAPPAAVVAAATKAAEEKAVSSFIDWAERRDSSSLTPDPASGRGQAHAGATRG